MLFVPMMLSISVRDPAQDTTPVYEQIREMRNPLDFELAAGWKAEGKGEWARGFEVWAIEQRENYVYYTGFDSKAWLQNKTAENSAFFVHRQSKRMLRGGLTTSLCVLGRGRIGVSNIWDHCEPAAAAYLGYKGPYVQAGVRIYGRGMESCEFRASRTYRPCKWLGIEPMLKYAVDRQRNDDFQAKLILKRIKQ